MARSLCRILCLLFFFGTVFCRDTRNYISIPRQSFRSIQNLIMSSLSDDTDDVDYNDQTNDGYQGNKGYQKEADHIYKYIKRGMGQCIFNCLKRPGQMNFIQCKSLCN